MQPCTGTEALYRPYGPWESRVIALPFHDYGTKREWGVSVTSRPLFTLGKDPLPIVQESGWDPGLVWTGAEYVATTGIRSPDRPARSQSLYWLSYPYVYGNLVKTFCRTQLHSLVGFTRKKYRDWYRLLSISADSILLLEIRVCLIPKYPYISHDRPIFRSPRNSSNWDCRITRQSGYKHTFRQNVVSKKKKKMSYFRKKLYMLCAGAFNIHQNFFCIH